MSQYNTHKHSVLLRGQTAVKGTTCQISELIVQCKWVP